MSIYIYKTFMEESYAFIGLIAFLLVEMNFVTTYYVCKRFPGFIIATFIFNFVVLGGAMSLKNYYTNCSNENEL